MPYEVTVQVGKYRYRRLMENKWNPERQRSEPVYLRTLGKVVGRGKSERVIPSPLRVDSFEASRAVGPLGLWWSLAETWGLRESIQGAVPENGAQTADAILCLVLNQLMGRRRLSQIGPWVADSPLARWADLEPEHLTKDRLEAALDALSHVDGDLRYRECLKVQQLAADAWRERVGRERAHAIYYQDVTRIQYFGKECEWAERGYGRVPTKPHVGFCLATGRKHKFPLLGFPLRGSQPDGTTVPQTLQALHAFGLEGVTIVWDRGFLSKANLGLLDQAGHYVLAGVPCTSDDAKAAMRRWSDADIEQRVHVWPRGSLGAVYVKSWRGRFQGHRGTWAVVLDPEKRTRERTERDLLVRELLEEAEGGRVKQLRDALAPIVQRAPGRRGWRIDDGKEADARAVDGRSLLFTTDPDLEGVGMAEVYHQRDEVEKAYRGLRGGASLAPISYRDPARVDAYLSVVCYWAYLLRAAADWTLRKHSLRLGVDQLVEALEPLHEVEVKSNHSTVYRWTHVSKDMARLLRPFGIQKLEFSA